jgi:hypothetical protein
MIDDAPVDIFAIFGSASRLVRADEQPELKISRPDRAFSTKNEFSFLKSRLAIPFDAALKFALVDASNL